MNIQETQELWKKLTPRDIEVVRAAADGSSIKQTAMDLGISVNTVQTHRGKVIKKLQCGNITKAVRILTEGQVI